MTIAPTTRRHLLRQLELTHGLVLLAPHITHIEQFAEATWWADLEPAPQQPAGIPGPPEAHFYPLRTPLGENSLRVRAHRDIGRALAVRAPIYAYEVFIGGWPESFALLRAVDNLNLVTLNVSVIDRHDYEAWHMCQIDRLLGLKEDAA